MSTLSKTPNKPPKHYEQDVYSFNDYSSNMVNGVTTPTLKPVAALPGMPYMISEAIGALSGPSTHYQRIDNQATQQGQATAHATVHNIAASNNRYCGLLAWSGFDYPSGNGHQVNGVKYTGVVDLFRIPKPGAAIYQAQVPPTVAKVIAPAFYWDFGATSPVNHLTAAMICSNLDHLEVFVGGKLFKKVTPDKADYGHLRFPPSFVDFTSVKGAALPELRIDGFIGSTKVASRRFSADHARDSLFLMADDNSIVGDGVDATRVAFRAVDLFGAPRPYVKGQVTFTITGPCALVGKNPFPFADTGAAGAIWIRSRLVSQDGSVTVTARHPALGSAKVTIGVVKP
jgi:beta-galactosidase